MYHVTHRGNNREFIFEDTEDKIYLLSSIADMKDSMGLVIMGYVVMSNHYHLLVKTGNRPLSSVLRYIHQNPVKAKMVENSSDYRWSSDILYRRNDNRFVDIDFILDLLSKNRKKAIKHYIEFMGNEDNLNLDFENIEVIGNADIKENLQQTAKSKTKTLDEILWLTGIDEEDFDLIKNRSRKRKLTSYKLQPVKEKTSRGERHGPPGFYRLLLSSTS